MRNIFFDLDGTLVDSRLRQYNLMAELIHGFNMSFADYWLIKREKVNQADFLKNFFNYDSNEVKDFNCRWHDEIERIERMKLDTPLPNVGSVLRDLSMRNKLYVVTARKSASLARQQIKSFGWDNYFDKILVTSQIMNKDALVNCVIDVNESDYFVGDTGDDIVAGKMLGVGTIAVTTGVLSEKILKQYNPDFVIENLGCANWL